MNVPNVNTFLQGNQIVLRDGCPYCGKQHRHGDEGDGMAFKGSDRGSHCGGGLYFLLPPDYEVDASGALVEPD